MIQNLKCKSEQTKAFKKWGTQASGERRPKIYCNCHVQMLIVAWIHSTSRGASICQMLKNEKNDDQAEQWLPWETNRKQHVHRKQVNKHETYRRTMCKHSTLSVCPTSRLQSAEPRTCVQLLSPCRQWASPGWDPPWAPALGGLHTVWHLDCTGGKPSHSLMFSNFLPLFLYHSIYFCLCGSHFVFPSHFSPLPRRSPQVAVTGGKDDEELHSRASWLSPRSLHPVLFLAPRLPSFLLIFTGFTSSLLSACQQYWVRELRDGFTCAKETLQWTPVHHTQP